MAKITTVCETNSVQYLDIRMAQVKGLRSLEEIRAATGVCGECPGCKEHLDYILTTVCGCLNISFEAIIQAVKEGASTLEKACAATTAGTAPGCGRCKVLIENIVEQGR